MVDLAIADAKALATQCRAQGVLIMAFKDGKYHGVSYGHTKQTCTAMKDILEEIGGMIEDEWIIIEDCLKGNGKS